MAAVWAAASCTAPAPPPLHSPLVATAPKTPLVLVPGVTGVALRDRSSDRIVWGRGWNLLWPRDGGHRLARPLGGAGAVAGSDGLVPDGLLSELRLFGVRKPIYGPLVSLLERHRYRTGNLERPRPGDTFFPFLYDWRQDNVAAARLLAEQLEGLRRARGEERLTVQLLCQSNGAHICRWLAKYGGGTLEAAEAGTAAPPPTLEVDLVVLIGSSNGGSLRILRELDRGRQYLSGGRRWLPETLFTLSALYQDLPAYRDDLFVDAVGEVAEVDLWRAETWRRNGWSVFSPAARRRLVRPGAARFGSEEDRFRYLHRRLERGRRFQRLLRRDAPGFAGTRYGSLQNHRLPTPGRAVLVERAGGRELRFTGDRWLRRRPRLETLVTEPGDGHATRASQLYLSPQEQRALLPPAPAWAPGGHFELLLSAEARRYLVAVLSDPEGDRRGVGAAEPD